LQSETPQEKTNAKTWLLDSQDAAGCWEGNIRNTAFILASIWPKTVTGGGGGLPDCEDAGYYCTTSASACTGDVLSEFDCQGSLQKCCTVPQIIETCAEQGGDICSSNQRCIGGTSVDSSDLRTGELCCAGGGSCGTSQEISDCELNDGICRAGGCADNEQEAFYSCNLAGDSCCIQEIGGRSYWWIWVLLILIILLVIAIIFRNRLRMLWFRMKSGGHKPTGPHYPSYPPMGYQRPVMRAPERRILMPTHHPQRSPISRLKSGAEKELDEVLKKLKEMSK
ncbi:MAG: hypothetical protein U1B79_01560, partial [Candidatus Pacearchaeota archaeon]|nr:hypothetical protein [Candidatus Pacearchaeota archaeon]